MNTCLICCKLVPEEDKIPCENEQCESICAVCFVTVCNGDQRCPYCRMAWLPEAVWDKKMETGNEYILHLGAIQAILNLRLNNIMSDIEDCHEWSENFQLSDYQKEIVLFDLRRNQLLYEQKEEQNQAMLEKVFKEMDEIEDGYKVITPLHFGSGKIVSRGDHLAIEENDVKENKE